MNYNILVDIRGNAYGIGQTSFNQLDIDTKLPEIIPNIPQIDKVFVGLYHSILLDVNGEVWITLISRRNPRNKIEQVQNLPKMIKAACGAYHTILLDENGQVWGFGNTGRGQFGLSPVYIRIMFPKENGEHYVDMPIILSGLPQIKDIGCSDYTTILIDYDGNVWASGADRKGELGLQRTQVFQFTKIENIPPMANVFCSIKAMILLDYEGNVWACGSIFDFDNILRVNRPQRIEGLTNIVYATSYNENSMYIDKNGKLFVLGKNSHGELGIGNQAVVNRPLIIEGVDFSGAYLGQDFSHVIDIEGNLWVSGNNTYGQLGMEGGDVNTFVLNPHIHDLKPLFPRDRFKTTKRAI